MKTMVAGAGQKARLLMAAVILVCIVVLTGMAEPQVKHDLNVNLPADLSAVQQHSAFTPLY